MNNTIANNTNNNRLYFIDNIKAFAMLLIIWGHCGGVHDFEGIFRWVYSFHVPIFFIISGYLTESRKNKSNLYFPKFRLLVPYCFYSIIYACLTALLSLSNGFDSFVVNLKQSLARILLLDGQIATWYIPCLIIAELIFWIETRKINIKTCLLFNFVMCIVACYIPFPETMWIAKVFLRVFPALFCFNVGIIVYEYKKFLSIFELIIISIFSVFLIIVNGNTDMYHMDTGKYPVIYGLEIALSSLLVFYLFEKFVSQKIKVFTWFGKNTLIILGTHQAVIYLLYPIINHFNIQFPKFIPSSLVLTLIVIIIEIPIILIINKWFEWTLGKAKIKI